MTYLDPRFGEFGSLRQFFPGVNIRILRPLKGLLQLIQLIGREGRPRPALFPFERNSGLGLQIGVVVAQRLVFH